MAFKQNNPLSRKTSPINKNWIKGAIKRPGAFKKKAEEAGMSTKAFAEKVTSNKDNYDSRTGKQAELAETLMGMSRDSFTMDELNETSKKQKIESKKQADKLPQIEFPGSDYEMDQDMSYPGGERGRDYNEEGTKDGMSRHTSEHSTHQEEHTERKDNIIKKSKGVSRKKVAAVSEVEEGSVVKVEGENKDPKPLTKKTIDVKDPREKKDNSKAAIKLRKSKQKSEGVSGSKRRANKAKSKSEAAAEKAKTAKNPDYKKQLEAKSERLAKRSKRKEERSKRKTRNKENRNKNKESRESQRS